MVPFAEAILTEVNSILYIAIGLAHQLIMVRKVSHVGSVALISFPRGTCSFSRAPLDCRSVSGLLVVRFRYSSQLM